MKTITVIFAIGALYVRNTVSTTYNTTKGFAKLMRADGSGDVGTVFFSMEQPSNITITGTFTYPESGWFSAVLYAIGNADSKCKTLGPPVLVAKKPWFLFSTESGKSIYHQWYTTQFENNGQYSLLNASVLIYAMPSSDQSTLDVLANKNNTMEPVACGVIRDIRDKVDDPPVTKNTTTSTTTSTTTTTTPPTTSTTTIVPPVDPSTDLPVIKNATTSTTTTATPPTTSTTTLKPPVVSPETPAPPPPVVGKIEPRVDPSTTPRFVSKTTPLVGPTTSPTVPDDDNSFYQSTTKSLTFRIIGVGFSVIVFLFCFFFFC